VINTLINPPGIEDEYLRCLNSCFPGWGDRRTFDWYFRRTTPADLIVFQKDGDTAAGSALTYRRLTLPNGRQVKAATMTGSWTLPDYRRQGFFSMTIDESLKLASERGAALLLAFVTGDNASSRRLASAGAALLPTWYLFSTKDTRQVETASSFHPVNKDTSVVQSMWERLEQNNQSLCRFGYADAGEFEAQFLCRPSGRTEIFQSDDGCSAILEINETVEQLEVLLSSGEVASLNAQLGWFLNRALRNQRQFFMFSSDERLAKAATEVGLENKAGYLTVLIADHRQLAETLGVLPETHPPPSAILEPKSPWFTGRWSIAGGERA